MAIGWHPYFAIPSGDRQQARLHIPASDMAEVNNYDDVFPTDNLIPLKGTKYDFTQPDGKPLGDIFLDDNFSHLTRSDGEVVVDSWMSPIRRPITGSISKVYRIGSRRFRFTRRLIDRWRPSKSN
jgi:galactose mutarotase-like enzyme